MGHIQTLARMIHIPHTLCAALQCMRPQHISDDSRPSNSHTSNAVEAPIISVGLAGLKNVKAAECTTKGKGVHPLFDIFLKVRPIGLNPSQFLPFVFMQLIHSERLHCSPQQ